MVFTKPWILNMWVAVIVILVNVRLLESASGNVNGGWSPWAKDSSMQCCTLGKGISQRYLRYCNNPVPERNGTFCKRENGNFTTKEDSTDTQWRPCNCDCTTPSCDGNTSFCSNDTEQGPFCMCIYGYTNPTNYDAKLHPHYFCVPKTKSQREESDNNTYHYFLTGTTKTVVEDLKIVLVIVFCGFLAASFAMFLILCAPFSPERILHANQELTLIATFLLFLFWAESGPDINPSHCKAVAILLHYLFEVTLVFFSLEALYTYSLITYIVPRNGFIPLFINLIIGYGVPVIVMAFSLAFHLDQYGSNGRHCFADLDTEASWYFIFPAVFLAFVCLVIAEAQREGGYDELEDIDYMQLAAAKISEQSILFVLLVTFGTYIFALLAVDQQYLAYWILFFIFITVDGPLIFVYHVAAHQRIRKLFGRFLPCLQRKEDFLINDPLPSPRVTKVAPTPDALSRIQTPAWQEMPTKNNTEMTEETTKF